MAWMNFVGIFGQSFFSSFVTASFFLALTSFHCDCRFQIFFGSTTMYRRSRECVWVKFNTIEMLFKYFHLTSVWREVHSLLQHFVGNAFKRWRFIWENFEWISEAIFEFDYFIDFWDGIEGFENQSNFSIMLFGRKLWAINSSLFGRGNS